MGVIIRGLNKTETCDGCIFGILGRCIVLAELENPNEETHSCPLIQIPDSHGDLVDRDTLVLELLGKEKHLIEQSMKYVYLDSCLSDKLSNECDGVQSAVAVVVNQPEVVKGNIKYD